MLLARRSIIVAALVLTAGCKERGLEFSRIELPGFSIEVPTFVKAPVGPEYHRGELQRHKFPGVAVPTMIGLTWQAGEILTNEEMPAMAKVVIDSFAGSLKTTYGATTSVTVGGQKATRLDASLDKVSMSFVDITCGKRSVMLSLAALDNFQAIRDRMLDSFVCKPIEAEEAKLGSKFPVGADDPTVFEGWRFGDEDRSVMTITNDELVVVFVETPKPDNVSLEQLRSLVPKLLDAAGTTFTPSNDPPETRNLGSERRIFERGTLTAEGETSAAVTSIWMCPDGARTVIALAVVSEGIATKAAVDFISKVRCAKAKDAPLPIAPYVAPPPE